MRPTTRLLPAGQTIEPSVSVPTGRGAEFAAGATAEPELEPHGSKSRTYGFAREPAAGAPAVERREAAEVRPLRQVGLAEDHRACRAQPRRRSARRAGTRLPTSASDPAVVSMLSSVAMLSLTRTGMPCSGPRSWPCAALVVELRGDRDGLRVRLDHRAERVQIADPVKVPERQVPARELAARHQSLQLRNRRLDPRSVGGCRSARCREQRAGARQDPATATPVPRNSRRVNARGFVSLAVSRSMSISASGPCRWTEVKGYAPSGRFRAYTPNAPHQKKCRPHPHPRRAAIPSQGGKEGAVS